MKLAPNGGKRFARELGHAMLGGRANLFLAKFNSTRPSRFDCHFCKEVSSSSLSTMKSAALVLSALSAASAFAPAANKASTTALGACLSREKILSEPDTTEFGKIWDPLGLAEMGSDETIAWYRHAEVKHGRVAMAAFTGWWAVGSGLRFPGELAHGLDFSSIPSKGLEAWDAVPGWGKAQMLLFAGLIELHDEIFFSRRGTHYMKGGTPGKVCISNRDCTFS